jgi:hypothetical protein
MSWRNEYKLYYLTLTRPWMGHLQKESTMKKYFLGLLVFLFSTIGFAVQEKEVHIGYNGFGNLVFDSSIYGVTLVPADEQVADTLSQMTSGTSYTCIAKYYQNFSSGGTAAKLITLFELKDCK